MSDLEKAGPTLPTVPPPSYHASPTTANFGRLYNHFVNDNMRAFPEPAQRPPQAYDHIDRPERDTRFPSKRRQALYFAIGLVLILTLCLTGYFALGKSNEHDDKGAARPAILPTTASTSTVTVSISVSIATTTTNHTVTSEYTTTVATTATIPSSIALAASSFYAAVSANAASALASEASIMSAATSLYPASTSTTLTTAALSPALTVVTTLPPTTTTATHTTEGMHVLCSANVWWCGEMA